MLNHLHYKLENVSQPTQLPRYRLFGNTVNMAARMMQILGDVGIVGSKICEIAKLVGEQNSNFTMVYDIYSRIVIVLVGFINHHKPTNITWGPHIVWMGHGVYTR